MKLSLDWLGDFITLKETDPQKISDAVTAHIAEVDEVEVQGALLRDCCVGEVLTVDTHPNADKLKLCTVKTDKGDKRVVCGGTNLRVGMKVAFAHCGATVKWHGGETMTLTKVKIRGEESEGMICAAEELGLEDFVSVTPEQGERAIVDLGDSVKTGADLRKHFGLTDVVLHIDNHAITHRPDLFSHIGFAREFVAIGIASWKKVSASKKPKFTAAEVPFRCNVRIKELVPRYLSCLIEIDSVGETPAWMKRRLAATGYRSLNLPIDITNYVAAEVGMPLHSFDADDIVGDVEFRVTKEGEKITTLDHQERRLPAGAIVLSDTKGIFDLMGIMGGIRSSTKETTKRIYLHSAIVDPVSIRNAIIATGHRTEASTVYEKTIPCVTAEIGLLRALELFLEHVPGARIVSKMENWGDNGKSKPIAFSVSNANSLLGTDLKPKIMKDILVALECSVTGTGDMLTVKPPLHRLKDLTAAHDLTEEIGRVYGYNKIEAVLPAAPMRLPARDGRLHRVRDDLAVSGYLELLPLSLIGPEVLSACGINAASVPEILNPIGRDVSFMTPSTLPALLTHAAKYLRNEPQMLRTFHVSKVFEDRGDSHRELGLLVSAKADAPLSGDPFLLAKREIISALKRAGYALSVDLAGQELPVFAHPGRAAALRIGDREIGMLFEVHPSVREAFGLPARAAAVLINVDVLLQIPAETVIAAHVPSHPAVAYDITLTMSADKPLSKVLANIRKSSELLESVEIADLYSGKPLQEGHYNVTLTCTYRASDRTLTEEETKKEFAKAEALTR